MLPWAPSAPVFSLSSVPLSASSGASAAAPVAGGSAEYVSSTPPGTSAGRYASPLESECHLPSVPGTPAALGSGRYAPPTHEKAAPSLTDLSDDIPENIP